MALIRKLVDTLLRTNRVDPLVRFMFTDERIELQITKMHAVNGAVWVYLRRPSEFNNKEEQGEGQS